MPHPGFDRQLLRQLDVYVVNEYEAAKVLGADRLDARKAVRALRALGPDVVVVTGGAHGAVYGDRDRMGAVPAIPVDVVDVPGAGDAFIGGLALSLSVGRSVKDAVIMVTRIASNAVRHRCALLPASSVRM